MQPHPTPTPPTPPQSYHEHKLKRHQHLSNTQKKVYNYINSSSPLSTVVQVQNKKQLVRHTKDMDKIAQGGICSLLYI